MCLSCSTLCSAVSGLRDHADKGQTHIVSAILNVDQDTDEPWPLHILGE